MMIVRVLAMLLGPPEVALAVAFMHHPELLDVATVTLGYFMIPYWLFAVVWFTLNESRVWGGASLPHNRATLGSEGRE